MFDVPPEVIERFRALGAVRCSVYDYKRYEGEFRLFEALVYFWDAQGREIGYWNRPCQVAEVFAPNYREWSADNLALQHYEDLNAQVPV